MAVRNVNLKDVVMDKEVYPRTSFDWHLALSYKQAMLTGARFPPIVVAPVEGRLTLIDGLHRMAAAKQVKRRDLPAQILPAMSKTDAYAEAVRRNVTNGKLLAFHEKLEAYRKLRAAGWSVEKISGTVLYMPKGVLRKYAGGRIVMAATGQEVVLRGPLKHLSGGALGDIEDQGRLTTQGSFEIIAQLNTILKNNWLDKRDTKVRAALEELYGHLARIFRRRPRR